jgi:type I restriction enzyme S subunit
VTGSIRLRYFAAINPSTPEFDRIDPAEDVTFLPLEAVWADNRLDLGRRRSKAEVSNGYVRFRRGDILCPKVTPTFQAGRSARTEHLPTPVGAASTEVHVLRVDAAVANPGFVRYALMTKQFLEEGVSRFQGVAGLQRVPQSFVSNFRVARRSLPDQGRIAALLEDQVGRIDLAIERVRTRSRLHLDRTRSLLIDQMLGDSAVTIPLRRLIVDERLGAWGSDATGKDDIHVARVADFDRLTYRVTSAPTLRSLEPGQLAARRLRNGDVLLERSGGGPDKPVGSAVFVDLDEVGPAVCSNFVSRLRPIEGVDGRYLSLVLAAMYEARINGAFYTQTTGIQNLDSAAYLRYQVPRLPSAEQLEKSSRVEAAIANTVSVREHSEVQIELLNERKSSLITAAITGDFDVSAASSRAAQAASAREGVAS